MKLSNYLETVFPIKGIKLPGIWKAYTIYVDGKQIKTLNGAKGTIPIYVIKNNGKYKAYMKNGELIKLK